MAEEELQSLEEFVEATLTKSELSDLVSLARLDQESLTEEQSRRFTDLLTKLTVAGMGERKFRS